MADIYTTTKSSTLRGVKPYLVTWFYLLPWLLYLHCPQVLCQNIVEYQIVEETDDNTYVGNFVADARLATKYNANATVLSKLRYRFLDQEDGAALLFEINDITGIIRTQGRIDRDTLCSQEDIECLIQRDVAVVSPDGHFDVMTMRVKVIDKNDNAPSFAKSQYTLNIPEAIPDASYNLPLAQDPDSQAYGIKQYMLTSNSSKFELSVTYSNGVPASVQLVLQGSLDREARDFYQLVLAAVDGGSPPNIGRVVISIRVGDANDHGPVFANASYEISIAEDMPVDSTLLRVLATDKDTGVNGQVIYSLSASNGEEYLEIFGIKETSGDIYLKQMLDLEERSHYRLTVEAKDGGVNSQPAYATVVINLQDVNDNPPSILVSTLLGNNQAQMSESDAIGKYIAHVSVRDPDGGIGGQFECLLDDPRFNLEILKEGRYEVKTAEVLDREIQEVYVFSVICEDKGEEPMSSTQQLTVTVLDENDNYPQFSSKRYLVDLEENNFMNSVIIRVNATDKDKGDNSDITYSLENVAKDFFTIDSKLGIILANSVFDYEDVHRVEFEVYAFDHGVEQLTSTATVMVNVIDTNDEPPRFVPDTYTFDVTENQPVGMEVGRVTATDADSDLYNKFEYTLVTQGINSEREPFTIDTQSGTIRTNQLLDREEMSSYKLRVLATNVGVTPPLSGAAVVHVSVRDVNDNSPVIDYPSVLNHTVQISNLVPSGYQVAVIQARDEDEGDSARIRYDITGHEDLFTIQASTGIILTKSTLRSYSIKLFEVTVSVSDHGFPPRTSMASLQVLVNRSLPYTETSDTILSGSNVDIVISLSVVSAVIMIILIVAIVVVKTKDNEKKRRKVLYQYTIEQQQQSQNVSQLPDVEMGPGEKSHRRASNASNSTSGTAAKKEAHFVVERNNLNNSTAGTRGSISSYQTGPVSHQGNYMTNQYHQQRSRVSWPTVMAPNKQACISGEKDIVSHRNHQVYTSSHEALQSHKPWELSIKNLEGPLCKAPPSGRGDDHDSDSAYSGDISNTDSGRGPSEEGENHVQGGHNLAFFTSTSGKITNPRQTETNGQHCPDVGPVPGSKHWTHKNKPQNNMVANSDRQHQTIKQMVANNNHKCVPVSPPVVPPREPKSQSKKNRPPPSRPAKNNIPKNGFHVSNFGYPLRPARSWDTIPEDDGGSTTSGSYVVDSSDLYLDDGENIISAVTV